MILTLYDIRGLLLELSFEDMRIDSKYVLFYVPTFVFALKSLGFTSEYINDNSGTNRFGTIFVFGNSFR